MPQLPLGSGMPWSSKGDEACAPLCHMFIGWLGCDRMEKNRIAQCGGRLLSEPFVQRDPSLFVVSNTGTSKVVCPL
eukprot:363905-Chlamydomonas_euryale.AAC.1